MGQTFSSIPFSPFRRATAPKSSSSNKDKEKGSPAGRRRSHSRDDNAASSTSTSTSTAGPINHTTPHSDSNTNTSTTTMTLTIEEPPNAVAVYCASSLGDNPAFSRAAASVGHALAAAGRPLVYGGGSKGIMGVVSGAVLEKGGKVTGVIPYAMVAAGGEAEQMKSSKEAKAALVALDERGRENVKTIVVDSMHERKTEMAKRSCAFVTLPGGYGTFEELLEVVTWCQIGIHSKPILVINVNNFYNPLRQLIQNGVSEGFIRPKNQHLIRYVDGPEDLSLHETFDWGKATLDALDNWQAVDAVVFYDWTKRRSGNVPHGEELSAV